MDLNMELVSEFLIFCLEIAFWYFVASIILALVLNKQNKKLEERKELIDQLAQKIHVVNIEEHNNQFYWFDADSDQFLAQGKDLNEIIERIQKRYPTHVFFMPDQRYIGAPHWTPTDYLTNKENLSIK